MDAKHWNAAPGERLTDEDWIPRDEPEPPQECAECGKPATEWDYLLPFCKEHYEERFWRRAARSKPSV